MLFSDIKLFIDNTYSGIEIESSKVQVKFWFLNKSFLRCVQFDVKSIIYFTAIG